MSLSVTPAPAAGAAPTADAFHNRPRRVQVIRAPSFSLESFLSGLASLARYRDLLLTLSMHRIKVRYKQSVLGISWALLQPLALMLVYTFIFSVVTKMPSDGTPYAVFTYAALLPWLCFSTALANGTNSLVSHASLVTKVYFPRDILPLTYVVAALCDFLIASIVLGAMMLYYRIGLSFNALYAVPIILVLTVFATSATLLLSATQVRFRDVGVAIPLLLQLWMFATPVVYPLSAVPARFAPFYVLNPMVGIIENFRRVILQGAPPDFTSLGVSALVSLTLLPVAYIYFKRVEATMADVI